VSWKSVRLVARGNGKGERGSGGVNMVLMGQVSRGNREWRVVKQPEALG